MLFLEKSLSEVFDWIIHTRLTFRTLDLYVWDSYSFQCVEAKYFQELKVSGELHLEEFILLNLFLTVSAHSHLFPKSKLRHSFLTL